MSPDDEPPKNPFVRFKAHVDSHIGAGLNHVLSLPSQLSSTVANSRQPGPQDKPNHNDESRPSDGDVPPDFRRWLEAQRRAVAREEMLDAALAETERTLVADGNEAARAILRTRRFDMFAMESPYSPLGLAHSMPRQPCPRDIHADMDPRLFTYVDAFEDLLAEASNKPMMDLRQRYRMNQVLRRVWPLGQEHPMSWHRRLASQGLADVYLPDPASPARLPRSEVPVDVPSTFGVLRELQEAGDGALAEIEKAVKVLTRVLEDGSSPSPFESGKEEDGQHRDPWTESDLYSAVQSAFNEAQRSLGAFFKAISDGGLAIEPRPKSEGTAPAGDVVEDEDGIQTTRSTKEYIDHFGNKHTTTEITRTSKDGNMVSTERHYSVRPASEVEKRVTENLNEPQHEPKTEEWPPSNEKRDGDRASGWFWK